MSEVITLKNGYQAENAAEPTGLADYKPTLVWKIFTEDGDKFAVLPGSLPQALLDPIVDQIQSVRSRSFQAGENFGKLKERDAIAYGFKAVFGTIVADLVDAIDRITPDKP